MRYFAVGMGSQNFVVGVVGKVGVLVVDHHDGDDDDQRICVREVIGVHVGLVYRLSSPEMR